MKKLLALCLGASLLALTGACVKVDNSLGKSLVDKSLLLDTYTVEFPLEDIQLKSADALSGYSDSRLTIGAIRDNVFGLTTRDAAFSLVPALDTINLGENPVAVSFSLYFEADTISCADKDQAGIFQNLYVTELSATLPTTDTRNTQDIPHGTQLITDGLPIYDGTGPLAFNFTQAYAQKYVDALKELGPALIDRTSEEENNKGVYDEFLSRLPGIYIRTDAPEGFGGRINLFNFSCLTVSSNYYTRNNNLGRLTVRSTWDGVQKDSTFLFIPGEPELYDEAAYLDSNTKFYQYCFNRTSQSFQPRPVTEHIYVEGGGGLKPVIPASEIKEKTEQAILAKGGNVASAVIIKASIILPYEQPEDYTQMDYFPSVLSPTICLTSTDDNGSKTVSFAGLTDASVSTENQGDIDRSNLRYAPDITYHLQQILKENPEDPSEADIWLLTVHSEQVANANGSLYDSSYYQQLMYASYYNSLYGGGYGYGGYGYGGYGGYGSYGYSNYYNYMMLYQMMAASSQQTYSTTTELDKDRYYRAILNGTQAERAPLFRVTFAVPKG